MKIVISGSAGTGKTTLARYISPVLGYPLIPDFADVVLNEKGYKSFKDATFEEGRKIRMETLERKVEAELKTKSFIS